MVPFCFHLRRYLTMAKRPSTAQKRSGPVPHTASKRMLLRRTVFLMLIFGVVLFIPLINQLYSLAILRNSDYGTQARLNQMRDIEVSASRGTIRDANGNVLAMSATVYNLILSPRDLVASVEAKDYHVDGKLDEDRYQAAIAKAQEDLKRDLLQLIPDLDEETLDRHIQATKYAYRVLKTDIEQEEYDVIQAYITEHKTGPALYLSPDTKRYYPYASLASQVIGFVNKEGGAYGIEAAYNSELEGSSGRVVTTKAANGTELMNSYSNFIDPVNGYDLNLTIDANIQQMAEQTLREGIEKFDVTNGAFCIVMNPKTGALLAIASLPDYDPNHYSQVTDPQLLQKVEERTPVILEQLQADNPDQLSYAELEEKAHAQALNEARYEQWSSKAFGTQYQYEPGSTFKAITLAAALEEGVVDENDTFYCSGSKQVADHDIGCSKRSGHGSQTLAKAVENSCNPAFIEIGQRLGIDKFYDYFEAFGMKSLTGVDLPSEGKGLVWSRSEMGITDLAVASFGQRFEVSPLQMITGFAATINGGHLLQPYIVESITDSDGTVLQSHQVTEVRQVISQETSDKVRTILEGVVDGGTGKNAYKTGYRIGGKTGTSETKVTGEVIVSFMGFAPADDPEILVLLAYDRPRRAAPGASNSTTGWYISGGQMAAPMAGDLIAKIMDYKNVEKQYSGDESGSADVSMPRATGQPLSQAIEALEKKGLGYRTVGEGDTVTAQIPGQGTMLASGSTVILYLGDESPEMSECIVPNVRGLGYDAARARLEAAGFYMRSSGSGMQDASSTAHSQSLEAGETAPLGTVISVYFIAKVEDGYVYTG